MSARDLLNDFAHALRTFADLDDDGVVEAWNRVAVFDLDTPDTSSFEGLSCEESPPRAFLLMRRLGDEPAAELWWPLEGQPVDKWPVVEVTPDGDTQVLALNAVDWIDTLLYSCGAYGGASEDDLEDAREDADTEAAALADDLLDELDRDLADPEVLGERWDEAQDEYGDDWMDAVEGLE